MKKLEKLHDELSNLSSQDQWRWIVENKDLIKSIDLDNDSTYVNFKGDKDNDYYVCLDDYIGDSEGAIYLLQALGINADTV